MCFNETASMTIFLGATLTGLYKYYNRHFNEGLFIISISTMQIAEYLVHRSIRLNDKPMQKIGSMMIYTLLYLQPLANGLINYNYPKKVYYFKDHMKYFVILFTLYTFLSAILFKSTDDYIIKSSHCKNSICRLNWQTLNKNPYISGALFTLYVCIHLLFADNNNGASMYLIVLLCALLYVLIFDVAKTGNIFGLWGSIWCFLGAAAITTGIL
jgi:hypothetical protein